MKFLIRLGTFQKRVHPVTVDGWDFSNGKRENDTTGMRLLTGAYRLYVSRKDLSTLPSGEVQRPGCRIQHFTLDIRIGNRKTVNTVLVRLNLRIKREIELD